MATDFERKESVGGLTFKLYRGEGVALLAFDLDQALATDDFVGFSIEVQYPGSTHWGALKNRLHFDYPPDLRRPRSFRSTEAPFQKFRWIHVPTEVKQGEFRYRVTACYMNAAGKLHTGAQVENVISLEPQTIDGFLNVGFTRGLRPHKHMPTGSTTKPESSRCPVLPRRPASITTWHHSRRTTHGWDSRSEG